MAIIMDRAANEAVPSMTAPMLTKVFRSESTCLRISVSAPPRVMKKLDILFLGGLFEVFFLMEKKIFPCVPEEGGVVSGGVSSMGGTLERGESSDFNACSGYSG